MTSGSSRPLRKLAVVADDLTGAADAAAPFALRGARVSLALSGAAAEDVDVLAMVSDTRWRGAMDAAEAVRAIVERAKVWGAETLFIKVDSTLRGNIRSEVGAALAAWGADRALGTPAFPAQGRVVRRGALVVHGEERHSGVEHFFPDGVVVLDAETDDDLAAIAKRVLNEKLVAVGSGGLARALADHLDPAPAEEPRTVGPVTGVLVVVGTTHSASRAQAEALLPTCGACLAVAAGAPARVDQAVAALAAGGRVLLTTDVAHTVEADSHEAALLAAELGEVVREISVAAPSAAFVLTGGATALAVATALGASEFRLLAEPLPGVVRGELRLRDRAVPTITKSGGFGAEDALLEAVTTLETCS